MTIPEAAQLVIQAGSLLENTGVFVLDMGDPVKIIDPRKKMVVLEGLRPLIDGEGRQGNDILIEIIGLRPGEKLFEELSYNKNLSGTQHPGIANNRNYVNPSKSTEFIIRASLNQFPRMIIRNFSIKLHRSIQK